MAVHPIIFSPLSLSITLLLLALLLANSHRSFGSYLRCPLFWETCPHTLSQVRFRGLLLSRDLEMNRLLVCLSNETMNLLSTRTVFYPLLCPPGLSDSEKRNDNFAGEKPGRYQHDWFCMNEWMHNCMDRVGKGLQSSWWRFGKHSGYTQEPITSHLSRWTHPKVVC